MPVPKKKLSATRQGNRRSHLNIDLPIATKCSQCSAVVRPHTACQACGYYRGELVIPKKAK